MLKQTLWEDLFTSGTRPQKVEYLYFESDGGFSRGPVSTDQDALVFPPTIYVEDGKTLTYRSRWQPSGDKAYDVVTEFQAKEAWVAGFKGHIQQVGR